MWSNLILIHTDKVLEKPLDFPEFESWHTCQRSIYVSDARIASFYQFPEISKYEIYSGYEAYRFLLEVASGVRSKAFGESEVLSQFKEKFSPNFIVQNQLKDFFVKLRDQILEHCKMVRSEFLHGHGRVSYGGIADLLLPTEEDVTIFGTGKLAQAIIPHLLKKNRKVTLVGRNSVRLKELSNQFSISTSFWEDYEVGKENLILASPVSIDSILQNKNGNFTFLDFRGEVKVSAPKSEWKYFSLDDILQIISDSEEHLSAIKPKIIQFISDLSDEREQELIHLPHGWDDLACYQN
ncbi:MAG: glutamyl-tRNA reductase [Leptospira sp.]|nr:glutamyl-tRNA reductase [Leptospira sp.]NCS93925.1 glutamyl-tRNA reductase [Leptospira sp.]